MDFSLFLVIVFLLDDAKMMLSMTGYHIGKRACRDFIVISYPFTRPGCF